MAKHSHHDHDHHDHAHHVVPTSFNRAFTMAILGNAIFVLAQIVVAIVANSTSLLADAIHNLGDVLGLIVAAVANRLMLRNPTEKASYGMKKTSILAALINGSILVFSCGIIASEAVYKLFVPTMINAMPVIYIAMLGIVVNTGTALLFIRGRDDLNIRAAYLHLLYDAWISLGVVISAWILHKTHWMWIDPVVGLLIALVIVKGTWRLFIESFHMIIDAVPKKISLTKVHQFLSEIPGVKQVHDLHIWALSTQENALSVHLWMPENNLTDEHRQQLVTQLRETFHIHHATIQVEKALNYCNDVCSKYT